MTRHQSSRGVAEPIYYTSLLKLSAEDIRNRLAASPEEAVRIAYAAAVGGSHAAQVTLGQMLLDGHGVKRDLNAAFRWFGIAANADDTDGINMLGRCHELGWGTAINLVEAKNCYQRAAAKNHQWAQFNLATMMLRESDAPGVVATALMLLVRSARQGNAKAMNMIGQYREFGWTAPINIPSAIRWYRRAADRGCFRGAAHLARFLLDRGEVGDAVSWYRRSAEWAPLEFCRYLASHLFEARNAALHPVARLALKRAAESDEAGDLFAYGHALAHGRGGPVDLDEATIWLGRAQAKGFPGALALIDDVRRQRTHDHLR